MDFCFNFILRLKHCLKEYTAFVFCSCLFSLITSRGLPCVLGNLRTVVDSVSSKTFSWGVNVVCYQERCLASKGSL